MGVAVVLIGGDVPDRQLVNDVVSSADIVIAVDGGVRIARMYDLTAHVLIGDLDSSSQQDRAWAESQGAEVIEFAADKDATDLELALDHAVAAGADRIVALGVQGGRLDHELGNWTVLSRPLAAQIEIRTASGSATVMHGAQRIELAGQPGNTVSLLPFGGDAVGVSTNGLRWPLGGETLAAGTSRGISNEFVGTTASVSLTAGTLLVVRP